VSFIFPPPPVPNKWRNDQDLFFFPYLPVTLPTFF
jgi:hypothetical protein